MTNIQAKKYPSLFLKQIQYIRTYWYVFPILTIFIIITYGNSVHNTFNVDDIAAIKHNSHIGDFRYVLNSTPALMRPLLYFMTYKVFGLNPAYYRLINLIFHTGNSWILFLIFSFFASPPIAFVAALQFAVHPLMTEAVTWISGGSYAQYSFFILASFYFYMMAVRNKTMYAISFLLFLIALMSSEKAVILPGIIIAYELYKGLFRHHFKQLIPIVIAPFFLLIFYIGKASARIESVSANSKEIIRNPLFQIPGAITSYIQLILWPAKLTLYHSELSMTMIEFIVRVMITLLLLIGIVVGYKKNRVIFFWLSFFIISLIPTLLPFKLSWTLAERYVYLGTGAILFLLTYTLFKICKSKSLKYLLYIFLVIWIIGLMVRTNLRNIDWQDENHLWLATAQISPSDPKTHNNIANIYVSQGKYDLAIEEYKTAIEIKPNYADAYHNLAVAYEHKNDITMAIKNYDQAVKYKPNLWQSYQNMGELYFQQKNYDDAIINIQRASEIKPDNALLYVDLAIIYHTLNKSDEAHTNIEKALRLDPNNQSVKQVYTMVSQSK